MTVDTDKQKRFEFEPNDIFSRKLQQQQSLFVNNQISLHETIGGKITNGGGQSWGLSQLHWPHDTCLDTCQILAFSLRQQ